MVEAVGFPDTIILETLYFPIDKKRAWMYLVEEIQSCPCRLWLH